MTYNKKIAELTKQLYGNVGQTERVIKAKQFIDENYSLEIDLGAITAISNS
jgi:hypothetical protein